MKGCWRQVTSRGGSEVGATNGYSGLVFFTIFVVLKLEPEVATAGQNQTSTVNE